MVNTKGLVSGQHVEKFVQNIKPIIEKYGNTGIHIEGDLLIYAPGNGILVIKTSKIVEEIKYLLPKIGI